MTNCCAGDAPLVIAQGGFSGVFPDSSQAAFAFALLASAPDTSVWCDVQLTKDGVGICLRYKNMPNSPNGATAYPPKTNKYVIVGGPKTGHFSLDFTYSEVQNTYCEYHFQLSIEACHLYISITYYMLVNVDAVPIYLSIYL